MEPFVWHGQWHVSKSDQRVGGTLRYSDTDGLRLTLFGRLIPGIQAHLSPHKGYPLVYGITTDGKWITLTHCLRPGSSWSSSGVGSEEIQAQECYVGAHFESLEELEFERAEIELYMLRDWVDVTGLSSPSDRTFSYNSPAELTAQIPNGMVRLRHGCNLSGGRHKLTIEETPLLVIEVSPALQIAEFDSTLYRPLRQLFTLIFGKPSPVDSFTLFGPHVVSQNGQGQHLPIEYIRQPLTVASGTTLTQPLLPYSWVRDRWPTIMADWFRIAKELEPICNLFFSLHEMEHTFMEPRFLMATQALEGYHRGRFPNEAVPSNDYKANVSSVLSSVPEALTEWTKAALARSGNEPTLRDRLVALSEKSQSVLEGMVNPQTFAATVTKLRNDLTHYDPKRRKPRPSGKTLLLLAEQSRLLLETLLLLELGASYEEAKAFVLDSERVERIRVLRQSP